MERIDRLVRALLTKDRQERRSRRGNNFTVFFHGMLCAALAVIFFLFYRKFSALYLSLSGEWTERFFELQTFSHALMLLFLVFGGASQIVGYLFLSERKELFSALPVPPRALLFSALFAAYFKLLGVSLFLSLILDFAPVTPLSGRGSYLIASLLSAALLPLLAVPLSAAVALPARLLLRLFRGRPLLFFLVTTLSLAGGVAVYSLLLGGVKELLLGGDLKYFFTARMLEKIAYVSHFLVPANFFARLLSGQWSVPDALFILLLGALLLGLVLPAGGLLVRSALKAESGGKVRYASCFSRRPAFFSLFFKEFLTIFRTPAYTLSCFSVAAMMPLMVYFGMSVGTSLVKRLTGVDCAFELALLLTLLYTSLTNVFCSTNISREGEMFYVVKALPVSANAVFGAKIALCMSVCTLAQAAGASLLTAARFIAPSAGAVLFLSGELFSFAQICFSTEYDFSHVNFPVGEGEAAEGSVLVPLLGLGISLLVGLGLFVLRLVKTLSLRSLSPALSLSVAGGICLLLALGAGALLFSKLRKRYDAFGGTL